MSANAAIAERFNLISKLLDLLGEDTFKVLAHAKAARVIGDLPQDLEPIARGSDAKKQLTQIDGIGPKIADKIIELVTTGKIGELEELRARVPAGVVPLMEIPGVGPKTVATLWKQGGVECLADLKRCIESGAILKLPRMGEKAAKKISDAIAQMEQAKASGEADRLHLGLAVPIAERIARRLGEVKGVTHVSYAGSARRGRETVADLDLLVATSDAAAAAKAFREMPEVRQVITAGDNRSSVRISIRPDMGRWREEAKDSHAGDIKPSEPTIQVDLRVVDAACWGAALMYFTGSKDHNVKLRERALKMGLTLNEYGLFPEDTTTDVPPQQRGVKPVACNTEEAVYHALGLYWIPPEMRENRGEIEKFERGNLSREPEEPSTSAKKPSSRKKTSASDGSHADHKGTDAPPLTVIDVSDIKSELHAHTTASDGVLSILQLATEAKRRGFHTIAVTDHSKSSAIAGGLSPDRLRTHINAIHAARNEIDGITILAGSEVDILADGSLDYDDDLLAMLDVVVASPHAGLTQDTPTSTKRLLKAIAHPAVRILGHPTGRLINKRPGMSPDMGEIIAAAKEHNVALEINAHWMRLDLRDTHVRMAVEAGALVAIDCDVHEIDDFDNLRYGVATGRRGWLTKDSCINTWTPGTLDAWLKRKKTADAR